MRNQPSGGLTGASDWDNRAPIPLSVSHDRYVESFNGSFRDECLNENWFSDLGDAREKIAQ
jgi:hypothetical protein